MVNLRQAFNAGVVAFWVFAPLEIFMRIIEGALLDIAFAASTIFVVRHIKQKPSP